MDIYCKIKFYTINISVQYLTNTTESLHFGTFSFLAVYMESLILKCLYENIISLELRNLNFTVLTTNNV